MIDPFIRRLDVEKATGLSRASIYAMMARGEFPKPHRIGKRAVGWRRSAIEKWMASREAL